MCVTRDVAKPDTPYTQALESALTCRDGAAQKIES